MSFSCFPAGRLLVALMAVLLTLPARAAVGDAPFDVLEFAVEGNTVLEVEKVERAVMPYLGPQRGMEGVNRARAALEQAYQDAGFLTVSVIIPEQGVEEGVVTLRVMEGRIEKLKVTGSRYFSQGVIREAVPELAPGTVPNFNVVQRQLTDVGLSSPDRRLTPLLRPGSQPDTMETELKVEDTAPLHASVEFSNRQSPQTHPGRASASLRYDNLWQAGHSVGVSWNVSPRHPSEQNYLAGNYSLPWGRNTLSLSFSHSASDIASVSDTSVVSKGDTVGLHLGRLLRGEGSEVHFLSAYVEYKHLKETYNLLGIDTNSLPMTYWRFGGQYEASTPDRWGGNWRFGAALAMGLRGVSGREQKCRSAEDLTDQFACRREGAQANWATVNGHLARDQRLPWGFTLQGYVGGQLSSGPLIGNEQYSIGGVDTVRGYLDGEQAGDFGWRTRWELLTPDVLGRWLDGTASAQFSVFYDRARAGLQQAVAPQESNFQLGSVGLGMRLVLLRRVNAYLIGARTLYGGAWTHQGARRAHMAVSADF